MRSEVVADGIRFGEGPVWCGNDLLVVTSVTDGALYRIAVGTGAVDLFADVGGGANGAALAVDGSIVVTQNGGIDFSEMGLFADPPPFRTATPGLQVADPDGSVVYLADDGFLAPNDLVVAADGRIFFTDPGHYPPPDSPVGRIMVVEQDGSVSVMADGFEFFNGIAIDPDGELVVIEQRGLQRVRADGSKEWIVEELGSGGGDGFCLDAEGRSYVASTIEQLPGHSGGSGQGPCRRTWSDLPSSVTPWALPLDGS